MKSFVIASILALYSVFNVALAGDILAGKDRAQVCTACHGQKGISSQPIFPNLAGQKAAYLKKQLTAYKNGKRVDPIMQPIVTSLTEIDIDNIAAYYESLIDNPIFTALLGQK
ncbi:MAG: cytochrome C [endosymbiont of Escarpia spicata]|uniref:Cytochrome C n=1 Tax=endosymbiont of Escarpia spicata TaxID=2200908 RepID=A0A370DVC2_9GAMM|nr:MAG: cytochrome C [endosymbiont of Escarpia spicata]